MDYEQLKGNLEDVLNDLRHLALSHESIQFDESLPCTAGGYGDVFKATLRASNNEPDRLVAVKELRRAGDPISRTRLAIHLARELRVWARLKHRNILELIGYHLNAQMTTALIVSPFMVNGNIIEYLEKAGHRTSDHERLKLVSALKRILSA
ncbi:hypothetical protein FRB90_003764 [Tulasnella sp. 427]|nr:hypothetical protein FRB90_003764 [Tulasnella sp. 427]